MENKPQTFPHLHPGSPSFGFHAWLEFAIAKSQITGSGHPSVQAELVRLGQEAQSCPSSEHGAGCGSRGWSRSQTHERCLRPEPHRDTLFCQSTARLCALQRSFSPCPGPGDPQIVRDTHRASSGQRCSGISVCWGICLLVPKSSSRLSQHGADGTAGEGITSSISSLPDRNISPLELG